MNYENILVTIEDSIAHIRLNRPAKRNAVNNGLLEDLEACFDSLGADAVGREIDPAFIASLPAGVDPNGENGEYHTFCYDGPIFRTPVPFRLGTPLRRSYRIRLDDGSEKSYSYWFADLQQA